MTDRSGFSPQNSSRKSALVSVVITLIGLVLSIIISLFITGSANTLWALVIMFAVIAFVVTFARLEWGVAAMIFLLYTQAYIIVGERYGVTNVVQGLIMLLSLSMGTRWIVYSDEFPQGWMHASFLIFFYCFVTLASVLFAENSEVAMPVAVETLKSGTIALIIAMALKNASSFRMAIWVLLLAGIFLGTLSVIQFATSTYDKDYGGYALAAVQNISGETNDYRLGGPVGDPNFFAQMMLVVVPLALDRLWNEKRSIFQILAGWALGVCTFTVLLTYSRGGFLAMAVVVIAMVAIFHRGQLRYLLAVVVVGLFLFNILPSRFTERIGTLAELLPSSSSTGGVAKDYSFRGRTSEAIVAFRMFADHPILGVGLGNYPVLYQKYSQRLGMDFRSEDRHAHSLYLEVAAETGLLGLFSFALLLWGVFRSVRKAQHALSKKDLASVSTMIVAFAFGFIGYLTSALFIHSAYPRNFWLLVGIALAIPRVAETEIEIVESTKLIQFRLE
jgi:O-antigen ligase